MVPVVSTTVESSRVECLYRRSTPMSGRARTTVDYAVGAALFVVVVAFVPTVLDPFVGDGGDGFAAADRTADQLTSDLLVEGPAVATAARVVHCDGRQHRPVVAVWSGRVVRQTPPPS